MFQLNQQRQQDGHQRVGDFKGPLLNEYKRKFVFKRILQTFFGGCLLKFNYEVPFYIYLFQFLLYILPFIISCIGILLEDLAFDITTTNVLNNSTSTNVSLITAAVFCLYINLIKIFLKIIIPVKSNRMQKKNQNSVLADEDVLEFDESKNCIGNCCTYDKLNYLIPNLLNVTVNRSSKALNLILLILKLLIDTSIAFFIIFSSVYFLSITYLINFYGLGGSIVVFIISWIVVCNALYALLIREPFEMAVYNTSSTFSFNYLSRAFYVCCFFLIENIYKSVFGACNLFIINSFFLFFFSYQTGTIPQIAVYWIKLFFLSLPILWSFGALPPFDAFFIYLIEQAYIHLFGGSASATNFRLIFQIFLSVILSMVYFIPNNIIIIALLSLFGYILSSIDFIHLFFKIKEILNRKRNRVETISNDEFARISSPTSAITHQLEKDGNDDSVISIDTKALVYHILMIILTIACSMSIYNLFDSNYLTINVTFQIEIALLYACICLFVIITICSKLQNIYLFGLFRNPLYPKYSLNETINADYEFTINYRKKGFQVLKYIRIILLKFGKLKRRLQTLYINSVLFKSLRL